MKAEGECWKGAECDHEVMFRNAQEELLWRLNEWWHGRNPGLPINWPGPR